MSGRDELRIESLRPELVDDYLRLFDAAFEDNPRWTGCYCAYYDDPCADDDWVGDASGRDAHRAFKAQRIRAGLCTGLLAFRGDTAVGWCNAGPRARFPNLRGYAAAIADPAEAVGAVMCFVVHPGHRRRGVASALLAAVDDHFLRLGLSVAEAYPRPASAAPVSGLPWSAASYHGTAEMFLAAGYRAARELGGFVVMRKQLAGRD